MSLQPVEPDVGVTHVVADDEEDVGLLHRRIGGAQRGQRRQQQCDDECEGVFHRLFHLEDSLSCRASWARRVSETSAGA